MRLALYYSLYSLVVAAAAVVLASAGPMSEAVLERVRDELELDETLSGALLVAAARRSLHLPTTETDLASQVREICEELGIAPDEDQPGRGKSWVLEEGVPPCGPGTADHRDGEPAAGMRAGTTAHTVVADVPGAAPPCYADALFLLEDPRQLHARATASPDRWAATSPVPWIQKLLAQLTLRNEFQGNRLHGSFIRLVSVFFSVYSLTRCAARMTVP